MSDATVASTSDALEPIKRVTVTEAQVDQQLARLRESIKTQLEAFGRESEAMLAAARSEAERARDAVVATARTDGDREAAQILADGTARAGDIVGKSSAELAKQQDAILTVILGEFRPASKRSA